MKLFCKKTQNFRALGAPPPDPRASGGWGLCPQTPSLRRLGASPPDPIGRRRLGAPPPDPPNSPPIANFWLRACLILHISAIMQHFGYKYNNIIPHRTHQKFDSPKGARQNKKLIISYPNQY